jgi:hypothetical protein
MLMVVTAYSLNQQHECSRTVAELISRKLYPVHVRACVCVLSPGRRAELRQDFRLFLTRRLICYESVFPRESPRRRDSALRVFELHGATDNAGSLLFNDESFE